MAWPFSKKITESAPIKYMPEYKSFVIRNQAMQDPNSGKGVVKKETSYSIGGAEEHPFDFDEMRKLYGKVPIVAGAIKAKVNSIVGNEIRIKSSNEELKSSLDDFLNKLKFNNYCRNIVRDAMVYGNAFTEIIRVGNEITNLVVRNPETMYVKRDSKGKVLNYVQRVQNIPGASLANQLPTWNPDEISHLVLERIADGAYGESLIHPLKDILQIKMNIENSMAVLADRKANAPIVVTVGTVDNPPRDTDINAIGADLQFLNNKTDWVFPGSVKIEALDVASKILNFEPFNSHFENQLIYGLRIPAVLLGQANVPEGLATAQMEMYEKDITSARLTLEVTLKKDILDHVIEGLGFDPENPDNQYSIEWEIENEEDKWTNVNNLLNIMNGVFTSDQMKAAAEKRIAEILALDLDPETPQLDTQPNESHDPEQIMESMSVEEFVGMNYRKFLTSVLDFLTQYNFDQAQLTQQQKNVLKSVLKDAFIRGGKISDVADEINDKVLLGEDAGRAKAIARTETVRAMNGGFINSYKERGVKKLQFLAVVDKRTDEECKKLDGQVFSIEEAKNVIPLHVSCRCRFRPVVD